MHTAPGGNVFGQPGGFSFGQPATAGAFGGGAFSFGALLTVGQSSCFRAVSCVEASLPFPF